MKTVSWLISGVALAGGLFFASEPAVVAQTESAMAIRVESNQVLVPTFVYDKRLWGVVVIENRCSTDSQRVLQEKGISVRQVPGRCWGGATPDLASKDFRLFQDGVEQTIQSVTRQHVYWWLLFDNYGNRLEYSGTPAGKWSTANLDPSSWRPPDDLEPYVIGYAPPQSAKGSCHHIKVSVDRADVVVYSRSQYCNVQHSSSDPLAGTPFGQQMEGDLLSGEKPKIPIEAQSGVFFADSGTPQAHLVLKFPWNSLHREWIDGYDHLFATIGVLGMVYGNDGALVARLSDQACCPRDTPLGDYGITGHAGADVGSIPTRYETQFDLPPGRYILRVILSDGKKFGRVDLPLSADSNEDTPLALSSVALCKRFHRVDPPEYTEGILPSKFVPLVSKGIEFTPTADPSFGKRDPLFAYFQIYAPNHAGAAAAGATHTPDRSNSAEETSAPRNASADATGETLAPQSEAEPQIPSAANAAGEISAPKSQIEPKPSTAANTTVQFQLKVTNLKTGQVQIDSGLRPADEFVQAGKPVIPIVQEIATHDLPKSNYRLEVQATDSAGHHTPWHAATFTIR